MCLLAVAFDSHPDYPLVFVGNRDEYHARPASPADWWDDFPALLGGRDLQAGGTWLAVNRDGQLAVVTNRPDLPAPENNSLSRGELVTGWLNDDEGLASLAAQHERYGGFSLLLTDAAGLHVISGGNETGTLEQRDYNAAIVGLSNTALNDPWPKLLWLERELKRTLADRSPDPDELMKLLMRTDPVPDTDETGVPARPFVVGETYGTRCCTVICIDKEGLCRFQERRFGPGGQPAGQSEYTFNTGFKA